MTKLKLGERNIDLTNKGSLMRLSVEELIWIARSFRKGYSFKENLIDYIIKIHGNDTGRIEK